MKEYILRKSVALSVLMMVVLTACASPAPTRTFVLTATPEPSPTPTTAPTATATAVPTPLGGGAMPRIAIKDGGFESKIRIGTITENGIVLSDIALSVGKPITSSVPFDDPIRWSPDGSYLAYINYEYSTGASPVLFLAVYDFKQKKMLWNTLLRKEWWEWGVWEILWSADSSWVSVYVPPTCYIINRENGQVILTVAGEPSRGQWWDAKQPMFYYANASKIFDPRTGKTDTNKPKEFPFEQFPDAEPYAIGIFSREADGIIYSAGDYNTIESVFLLQNDEAKELLRIYSDEFFHLTDIRVLKSPDESGYLIGAYVYGLTKVPDAIGNSSFFTFLYKADGNVLIKKDPIPNNIYPITWSPDSKIYIGISAGKEWYEYWVVIANADDNSVIRKFKLTFDPWAFTAARYNPERGYTGFDIFWGTAP
jgi:hypothetical protein